VWIELLFRFAEVMVASQVMILLRKSYECCARCGIFRLPSENIKIMPQAYHNLP
jgi:hypothetical protein